MGMRSFAAAALLLLSSGCLLHSEVEIRPLDPLPTEIIRGSDLFDMLEIGDYGRCIALAQHIEGRARPQAAELVTLGECELAAYRLNDSRRHLRAALDLKPPFQTAARISWSLSKVEYLADNFAAAGEWARMAVQNGIRIKRWHLRYLDALSQTRINQIHGTSPTRLQLVFGRPNIPRIKGEFNGHPDIPVFIDSGAVLSIISRRLADRIGVRSLGDFEGEFYGLLGEPIPVRFGMIDSLKLGRLEITNVPVAIMADRSLRFFTNEREPFDMDFLLGTNVLRQFRTELDFRRRVVTFAALGEEDRTPASDQNLFFSEFRPMVHAMINRRGWYLLALDTGSEITFLNSDAVSYTKLGNVPRVHGSTLQGLGGSQKHGQTVRDVQIGVDKWAGGFRDIPLYSTEYSSAMGIIGQNFMKNFRVVIDFGQMRFELHRDRPFGFLPGHETPLETLTERAGVAPSAPGTAPIPSF